jgi:hypothetical protein
LLSVWHHIMYQICIVGAWNTIGDTLTQRMTWKAQGASLLLFCILNLCLGQTVLSREILKICRDDPSAHISLHKHQIHQAYMKCLVFSLVFFSGLRRTSTLGCGASTCYGWSLCALSGWLFVGAARGHLLHSLHYDQHTPFLLRWCFLPPLSKALWFFEVFCS